MAKPIPEHNTRARYLHRTHPCKGECGGLCKAANTKYIQDYRKYGPHLRGPNGFASRNTRGAERHTATPTIERRGNLQVLRGTSY